MSVPTTPGLAELYWQSEQQHQERRGWHDEAMERNRIDTERHNKGLRNLAIVALLRPLIELAILIVLLVKL